MCPARFAYQVWECATSAPSSAAAIDRSVDIVCRAEFDSDSRLHGLWATAVEPRLALAVHRQVDERRQLAGQVLHVHAGAPVDLGRVLAGEQRDPEPVPRLPRRDWSLVDLHALADHGHAVRRHGEPAGAIVVLVDADLDPAGRP